MNVNWSWTLNAGGTEKNVGEMAYQVPPVSEVDLVAVRV